MEITISNYTGNLRKLYYVNGKDKWYTYRPVRNFIIILTILLAVALYFLNEAFLMNEYVVAAVMLSFCFFVFLLLTAQQFIKYFKWKKSVEEYINNFNRFENCKLILNDNSFEIISDELSHIEKWDNFKRVDANSDYISIENTDNHAYLFPSASMSKTDFESLCEFIRSKTK